MAWFKLTKKNKKTESGTILLKMLFGSEKDKIVALDEHRYLVKLLLQRHLKTPDVRTKARIACISSDGQFPVSGNFVNKYLTSNN